MYWFNTDKDPEMVQGTNALDYPNRKTGIYTCFNNRIVTNIN